MARRISRRGFTLIELIIGLLIGTLVLSAAISFLITHMRTLEGSDIRENVARNDRYIGALLRRDLQLAGIELKSSTEYGSVGVWPGSVGDTLMVLYVPADTVPAPVHSIDQTLPQPGKGLGTCGARCLDVQYDSTQPIEIAAGDLARIDVEGVRRLIMVNDVQVNGSDLQISFTAADTLLRQPAGINNFQIKIPGSTSVQKLAVVMFYLNGQEQLVRAQQLNMDGTPNGDVAAYGVEQFDASLIFADGDTLPKADPYDSDITNDYDDIVAVQVMVTVKADRTDPRVNKGQLLKRTSVWRVSPRNLRYEKNRKTP